MTHAEQMIFSLPEVWLVIERQAGGLSSCKCESFMGKNCLPFKCIENEKIGLQKDREKERDIRPMKKSKNEVER